jgi:hypothetical protein
MARVIALLRSAASAVSLVLLALAVGPAAHRAPAAAQPALSEGERMFRAEVDPEPIARGGWAIQGYVYSEHDYRVGGVRLRCAVLDAAGQEVNHAFGWVVGDVPPRGRAYFYVHVPARGAGYSCVVLSFYPIARGGP